MSSLVEHARFELRHLINSEDEMDREMAKDVIYIIKKFSKQGHSGFSAPYAINLIKKLINYEILSPLTGEDDEWEMVGYDGAFPMYQNKRCGNVFKVLGKAYDIDGKIFEDEYGTYYTSNKSKVYIKFPYTPKSKYIKYNPILKFIKKIIRRLKNESNS